MNMQALSRLSRAAKADLGRNLRDHRYEISPAGILFPRANLYLGGAFRSWVNRADEQIDPNVVTLQGLTYALKAALAGFAQISSWYVAPFSGNVEPTTALTAANFVATQTEFTNYDEATRVAWAQDAESGQLITNDADKADFTIAAGGGTVWGAALTSASAKSAVTGTLLACSKFSNARVLLEDDVLTLEYTITAADG